MDSSTEKIFRSGKGDKKSSTKEERPVREGGMEGGLDDDEPDGPAMEEGEMDWVDGGGM